MIVKVCGMRDAANIRAVEALGIHWMGFIFWPGSSRFVSKCPAYLPVHSKRVGVFVDAGIEEVVRQAEAYRLNLIQLHGNESPDEVALLRTTLSDRGIPVAIIKAFCVKSPADIAAHRAYDGLADYYLFDTRKSSGETGDRQLPGGTGQQFDWSLLDAYCGNTPFLLSGGIGPYDAQRIRLFRHPQCVGIDLNSRFETAPGLKDLASLRCFLTQLTQN